MDYPAPSPELGRTAFLWFDILVQHILLFLVPPVGHPVNPMFDGIIRGEEVNFQIVMTLYQPYAMFDMHDKPSWRQSRFLVENLDTLVMHIEAQIALFCRARGIWYMPASMVEQRDFAHSLRDYFLHHAE